MISHSSYDSYDFSEDSVWKEKGKFIQSSSKKNEVKKSPAKSPLSKEASRDSIINILPSI